MINGQHMRRISIAISVVIIILSINSVALAQDQEPNVPSDDEVNAIARKMYCPVCENVPLDVCPTQACMEWRELIRSKLSEGYSEQEVMVYFVNQYGYRVLSEPPKEGFNWLVYLVPALAIIIGVVFLMRVVRTMKSTRASSDLSKIEAINNDDLTSRDEYIEQIEDKLRNL